jgi:hypothetical protein
MNFFCPCLANPIKKPKMTLHDNNYAHEEHMNLSSIDKPSDKITVYKSDYLYVILPYFNYCQCKSRYNLFIDFIERYNNLPGIRLCIIEARLNGTDYKLPTNFKNIYKSIGITLSAPLWIKESLINLAIKHLPKKWKYVAWIDADITFLNTNWVSDTILKLQTADIVQIFQTCVNMGPSNEAFKIDKSFCFMNKTSKNEWRKDAKYGFWHSGYAWACTRKAYEAIDGLIDFGILGAGDHHMSLAFIGKVDCSHPDTIHQNYKNCLLEFQAKCLKNKLQLDYVPGTIIHHWHGRLEDRKYKERWTILTKNQYDPLTDIYYTNCGFIQYTDKGKRLIKEISQYFNDRNEDSNII